MQPSQLKQVHCPLCKKDNYTLQHSVNDIWQIVQCTTCAMVYTNPRLDETNIKALYQQDYFHNSTYGYSNYDENPHLKKLNFKQWIEDAIHFLPNTKDKTALDVGCAAGYAFETYKALGIKADGLEIDTTYVKHLQEEGREIYAKPLLENTYTKQYDVISMFDVVEHLTQLQEHFTLLHSLLQQGGLLIIVTPDYNSTQRKIFGKRWFQFKPMEHINYFTEATLTQLANQHGFTLQTCKKSGQYADAAFLIDRLQKYNLGFFKIFLAPVVGILKLFKKPFYLDAASIYCVFKKN